MTFIVFASNPQVLILGLRPQSGLASPLLLQATLEALSHKFQQEDVLGAHGRIKVATYEPRKHPHIILSIFMCSCSVLKQIKSNVFFLNYPHNHIQS